MLFEQLKVVVAWRAMPNDLLPWHAVHAVYDQAQRWLHASCLEALVRNLRAMLVRSRCAMPFIDAADETLVDVDPPKARALPIDLLRSSICSRRSLENPIVQQTGFQRPRP